MKTKARLDFFYKRNSDSFKYDYILGFNTSKKTFLKDLKNWISTWQGKGYIQFYDSMNFLNESTKYRFRIFEFNNGKVTMKRKSFKI